MIKSAPLTIFESRYIFAAVLAFIDDTKTLMQMRQCDRRSLGQVDLILAIAATKDDPPRGQYGGPLYRFPYWLALWSRCGRCGARKVSTHHGACEACVTLTRGRVLCVRDIIITSVSVLPITAELLAGRGHQAEKSISFWKGIITAGPARPIPGSKDYLYVATHHNGGAIWRSIIDQEVLALMSTIEPRLEFARWGPNEAGSGSQAREQGIDYYRLYLLGRDVAT